MSYDWCAALISPKEWAMVVHPIVTSVSFIRQVKDGSVIGSATGFFFERGDDLFLVTNEHVVHDEDEGILPDLLRLSLHRDPNDVTDNGDYDVALYAEGQPLWKTPPQHPADVSLLRLNRGEITNRFFIKALSAASFLPEKYELHPGEDVFVMGYPLGFYDERHNLPVFRNAMIGSVYGVPFKGLPLFLTDANLHPGTSGSPVITKPKSTWVDNEGNTDMVTGTVYYLVGIHSGTWEPRGVPVGLGAAWYAQLIEDTAASFPEPS